MDNRRATVALASLGLEIPPETLDVGPLHREQTKSVPLAPDGELAEVERIRVTGEPTVSGEEAGKGKSFPVAEKFSTPGARWAVVQEVSPHELALKMCK
ncbi:MAG: hypothetical protein ACRDV4_00150 [Acidimicrobiales bacterium]